MQTNPLVNWIPSSQWCQCPLIPSVTWVSIGISQARKLVTLITVHSSSWMTKTTSIAHIFRQVKITDVNFLSTLQKLAGESNDVSGQL